MASSGSFNTTGYNGDNGKLYLVFSWSIKSQDIATNKTVINWSLKGAGLPKGYYYKAGGFKVVINGQTVYSKDTDYRIELYTDTVVASGTATISHNTDGTKKFSASAQAGIYTYAVNCSGSGSWDLTAIPRYATIKHGEGQKDETSIAIDWSSDSVIDYLWYSKDNGSNWTGINVPDGKSGYYTITGLKADTTYKIKTRVRRKDSQLTTDSSALSVTTYDYPHCIESPDFTIGNPVTLKFYNPLYRTLGFNIIANGVQLTYDWTAEGKEYEGIYADGVQDQLYRSIPNSPYGTYKVVVTYGDSVRTYDNGNKYHIDATKCLPIFNAQMDYTDKNPNTVAVTGGGRIVKDYSILYAGIREEEEMAVAVNHATITHYTFSIDTISQTVPYTQGVVSATLGVIKSAGSKRLTIRAYDSRGLSSAVYEDIYVYDYNKPIVYADIQRLNNFEAQTTIKISGKYSPLNINGTNKNGVSQVFYRYRETDGSWTGWTEVTVYGKGTNEYYCSDVVKPLDNSKSFEFEFKAIDKLDTGTATGTVGIGQAIFFISSNQKACFINGQKIIMYDVVDTWGGW